MAVHGENVVVADYIISTYISNHCVMFYLCETRAFFNMRWNECFTEETIHWKSNWHIYDRPIRIHKIEQLKVRPVVEKGKKKTSILLSNV